MTYVLNSPNKISVFSERVLSSYIIVVFIQYKPAIIIG